MLQYFTLGVQLTKKFVYPSFFFFFYKNLIAHKSTLERIWRRLWCSLKFQFSLPLRLMRISTAAKRKETRKRKRARMERRKTTSPVRSQTAVRMKAVNRKTSRVRPDSSSWSGTTPPTDPPEHTVHTTYQHTLSHTHIHTHTVTNLPTHSHIPLPIGTPMFPLPKEPCVKMRKTLKTKRLYNICTI